IKDVRDVIEITPKQETDKNIRQMSREQKEALIKRLTVEMKQAAKLLEFEHAAEIRDRIEKLRKGK
ncbi:MAG: UvrB/UvrC motif-containing protein, partial [Clostridia bacterium]|nr:UvrB/UvrC motif-containing protein [Clostridia bacterium]